MHFQMKASTRRIVHLFRRPEEQRSATISPKKNKDLLDIRALQQQEFEDIHKVMVEVRRELKIPRMQLVTEKLTQSNFTQAEYQTQSQMKSTEMTTKQQTKTKMSSINHQNQSFAFEPSRLNAEIIQFKRLKQELPKDKKSYQQMIVNSQRDTFRLKVNHNSSLSYVDGAHQDDNSQMISILDSKPQVNAMTLPVYGQHIKKYTRVVQQDLSSTIEDIHSLYITAPPTLQRRVCIRAPQKIQSLIEKVEDNSIKLINQCKNFFECKQKMNNKFDELLKTLERHRPLTQSIRNRSYTFQKSHDNIQSMRKTADEMRKTFFRRNNDQRIWYTDLLQEFNKSNNMLNKSIFEALRNILEDGNIIKADDIIQIIQTLNLTEYIDNPLVQQLMNDWDLNFIKQDDC